MAMVGKCIPSLTSVQSVLGMHAVFLVNGVFFIPGGSFCSSLSIVPVGQSSLPLDQATHGAHLSMFLQALLPFSH